MKKLKSYRDKVLLKKYLRRRHRIKYNKRKKSSQKKLKDFPKKYITIPNDLNFANNWENFVNILNQIQYAIKYRFVNKKEPIRIDHSKMLKVSSSGILVLASTIERAQKFANIKFKGNFEYLPKDDVVKYLLNEIDYWKYFDVPKLETSITQNRFSFFQILDSYEVDNTKIGKMIEFFEKQVGFNANTKELLFTALCEASANAVEHGYNINNFNKRTDRWWLTANIDKEENTISFVFYDQGMGIFKSLENHKSGFEQKLFRKVKRLIKDKANAKILKHMLRENYSRHNKINRGYGMQTFKKFIDEAKDGLLFIASDDSSYEYPKDILKEYKNKLSGTLIVWKIKVGYDINKNIFLKKEEK
jgi:anti-sigma regulatory factor (Ser/Thr protein kinase)